MRWFDCAALVVATSVVGCNLVAGIEHKTLTDASAASEPLDDAEPAEEPDASATTAPADGRGDGADGTDGTDGP